MGTARSIFGCVSAMCLAGCATPASTGSTIPAPSISKIDARAQSEVQVRRIILGQFGDILTEYPRLSGAKRPKNSLMDLSYWTKPISADTRNLCKFSTVTFQFLPATGKARDASTPMRVSDVETSRLYFLIGEISSDEFDEEEGERATIDRQCGERSPNDEIAFNTDDEDSLTAAILWLQKIAALSDEEFARIPISCEFGPALEKQGCREVVRGLGVQRLSYVEECPSREDETKVAPCVAADIGDIRIEVTGRTDAKFPESISAYELIVFADSRLD